MASIDQLNFEVILNDTDFKQKVQSDIQLAKDLNTNLTNALNVASRQTSVKIDGTQAKNDLQQITTLVNQMVAALGQNAQLKIDATRSKTELQDMKKTLDQILQQINNINSKQVNPKVNLAGAKAHTNELRSQGALMRQLSTYAARYFSIYGAVRFFSQLVKITGEFEVQKMALRTILNDVQKADVIFEKLRQFAIESPYTFQELAKYTKQLAAFDIPADKLLETNKMLADVAAGLGVSMDRLILAYGHVKSSGFLRGMQLRQFTQNGVPILEQLRDILGEVEGKAISVGDVFDRMTKRQIDFSMVEEAFKRMTSEGGKFFQMQEVLVDTLQGKLGKLRDVWQQQLATIGEQDSAGLKGMVDTLTKLVRHLSLIIKLIKPVVAGLGAYAVAMGTITLATKAFMGLKYANYLIHLATNLNRAAVVSRAFGMSTAAATGGVSALVGILVSLVTIGVQVGKSMSESAKATGLATESFRSFSAELSAEKTQLKEYINKLNEAEQGTRQYDHIRDTLLSKYGQYLNEIDKENIALGQTAGLYEKISNAIQETAKQKFLAKGSESIQEKYQKDYERWAKRYEDYMKWFSGESKEVKAMIEDYLQGRLDFEALPEMIQEKMDYISNLTNTARETNYGSIRWYFMYIEDEYKKGMARLENLFNDARTEDAPEPAELVGWRKLVADAIANIDDATKRTLKLEVGDTEDYFEYLERVGKEWKEVREQRDKALKVDKPVYEAQLKAIEQIDKALEGNILSDARYQKSPWLPKDKSANEAEKALNDQIALMNKLRQAYESLQPYISDDAKIKDVMKAYFDKSLWGYINDDSFKADNILALIDAMEKLNPQKAESLRAALGKNGLSGYIDSLKAQKTYTDFMKKWKAEDFNLSGTGVAFDISKIVRDYNTALNEIEIKTADAIEKAKKAYENDPAKLQQQIKDINALAEANRNYAKSLQQEKVNDLATKYVKEAYQKNNINLRNLSRASFALIDGMMDRITELQGKGLDLLSEEDLSKLKEAGIDIEALKKAVQAIFNLDKKGLLDRSLQLSLKRAKSLLSTFNSLSESIKEMGKGSDMEEFTESFSEVYSFMSEMTDIILEGATEIAESVADVAEDAGEIAEGAADATEAAADGADSIVKTADIITMAIKLVALFVKNIANAISGMNQLANSIAEAAEKARRSKLEEELSKGVDSIFSENQYRSVENAIDKMRDLNKEISDIQSTATGYLGKALFFDAHETIDAINKTTSGLYGLENVWIRKKKTGFLSDPQYISMLDASKELGYDLYDAYGHLNAELVDAMLNTYQLSNEQRQWLTMMKDNSELYTKAVEQVEKVMKSLFGQMVDKAADNIIDSWVEAGKAALDYADILNDVARAYAKMVLKSAIIKDFFDDKKAAEVASYFMNGEDDKALAVIKDSMEGVANAAPVWEKILEAFDPYFKKAEEEGGNTLGEAIKNSITEEQANLLASYINAMRADLSVMRGKQLEYFGYMFETMPTLQEHLAAIEAHTYNTAISSAEVARSSEAMLAELRSVIGSTTGLTAIRVEVTR